MRPHGKGCTSKHDGDQQYRQRDVQSGRDQGERPLALSRHDRRLVVAFVGMLHESDPDGQRNEDH